MEALAERKSTAKLTELLQIERRVQKKWEDEKVFEEDAPLPGTKEASYGLAFYLFFIYQNIKKTGKTSVSLLKGIFMLTNAPIYVFVFSL